MSSPPTTTATTTSTTDPPKRARRPSKFIEGSPLTRPDLLQRTPTSNELFFTILSEMDEFEKRRRLQHHRGSQSSVESVDSATSPSPSPTVGKPEQRRSFGHARPTRSLEADRERRAAPPLPQGEETFGRKFKGRLRALTGGKGV